MSTKYLIETKIVKYLVCSIEADNETEALDAARVETEKHGEEWDVEQDILIGHNNYE